MLDKMRDWNVMEIVKERQEKGIKLYCVKNVWPERLQQSAVVCVESPKFGPLQNSYSWNRAKSIVILIIRGERKPRTESEKVVEIQTARVLKHLKFEQKAKTESSKFDHRKICSDRGIANGVSNFEMKRVQCLESGAESARSKRTKEVHAQHKDLAD
jgi:hypothetical protein